LKELKRAEIAFYKNLMAAVIEITPKEERWDMGKYLRDGLERLMWGSKEYGAFFPGKYEDLFKESKEEATDIPVYTSFNLQTNSEVFSPAVTKHLVLSVFYAGMSYIEQMRAEREMEKEKNG
jgi:hypothetical protein